MSVEVVATDDFVEWFDSLAEQDVEAVARAVERLEQYGVTLGHPHSSKLAGSKYPLRELRVQSGGRPVRIFYAFDPLRQAVLLIGGDKTGDDRFYERMIPLAERIWSQFLTEQVQGLHPKNDEDG